MAPQSSKVAGWDERLSLPVRALRLWSKYGPRMRAAFPNLVGARLLSESKIVLRSASGARFAVEPSDLGNYLSMLNGGFLYPRHVLDTCLRLLVPGDVFFDVGANIGFVTIEVAHAFAGEVRVFAFEPQPGLAEKLDVSAALNGITSVRVFDMLLGEELEGTTTLYLAPNSAHASVVARSKNPREVTRQRTTIDHLVDSGTIAPPRVIKIDVEGAEAQVLRGARKTIAVHRPALIFEADDNMTRFRSSKRELFDVIASCGDYRFYDVVATSHGTLDAIRVIASADASRSDDVLALPADRPPPRI